MSAVRPPLNATTLRRIAIVVTLAVVLPLAWLGSLDTLARDYVDSALKRALVTFATARAANAVISVLQETTVAISPLGLGVTTGPGQILDPLNDLVEQFGSLMLAACVSLGIQRVLISVGGYAVVSAVLSAALLLWAVFAWRAHPVPRWVVRLAVLLLFVRFAVPIAALASEAAFRAIMSGEYTEAQSQVDVTSASLKAIGPGTEAKPEGLIERWKQWYGEQKKDVATDFGELKARAENAVRYIITLMALFVVQTVLLPIGFLWLAYRLFGAALSWPLPVHHPRAAAGRLPA